MSPAFSDPARSIIKNSPGSRDFKWLFTTLILHMEWLLEEVSFLNVDAVALFFAACRFKSTNYGGFYISTSLAPAISTLPNLFSPTLTGAFLFSRSVASFPSSWMKDANSYNRELLSSLSYWPPYLANKSSAIRVKKP